MQNFMLNAKKTSFFLVICLITVQSLMLPAQAQVFSPEEAIKLDYPWYDPSKVDCGVPNADTSNAANVVGNGRQEQLFNFLRSELGLTAVQAAVVTGVTMGESGPELDPKAVNPKSKAYGIAQWLGSRKSDLDAFAAGKGTPASDFVLQMQFLVHELKTTESKSLTVLRKIQSASDIDQGVYDYEAAFERSGHELIDKRRTFAKFIYNKYGQNAAPEATADPAINTQSASNTSACCATGPAIAPTGSAPAEWVKMYTGANASKVAAMAKGSLAAKDIKVLVIHYTADNLSSQQLLDYFAGGAEGNHTGIQFHVDLKGSVAQFYPLEDMKKTYHVKNMNSKAIGIEIAGKSVQEVMGNEAQFKSVVSVAKTLCDYYSIPCGDPKGDITRSSAAEAQGMLGHDESPTNDHSDPDGVSGSLRFDSSKHPYMMRLRQALGYNPTPGKTGGSTSAQPVINTTVYSPSLATCNDTVNDDGTAKDPAGDGVHKKLAAEAVRYATKENPRFRYVYGSGHGSLAEIQKMSYENGIQVDCSGFIRYIIWTVYKFDIGSWIAPNPPMKYFKPVSASEVQAGDIATRPGHVDFITDNMGGGKIHQFGAHSTARGLYGGDTTVDRYTAFYRYIGPTNAPV